MDKDEFIDEYALGYRETEAWKKTSRLIDELQEKHGDIEDETNVDKPVCGDLPLAAAVEGGL